MSWERKKEKKGKKNTFLLFNEFCLLRQKEK